jgi:type IV secretion system protein VirD4
MRRSPNAPDVRPPDEASDRLLLAAVVAALGVTLLLWVVGQVAAVLFGAHHWLNVSLAEMAGVPLHLIHHPGDPALAWPATVRGQLPGPVGMYATLVLVLSLPGVLAVLR